MITASREIHIKNEEMFRFVEAVGPTKKHPVGQRQAAPAFRRTLTSGMTLSSVLQFFDDDGRPGAPLRLVWEDLLR